MNATTKIKEVEGELVENDPKGQAIALAPSMTPMGILDRAVAQGANVETLEKLMGLQERFEKNQARKEFDEAVAAAKAEIPPIVRNRQGHNEKRYVDFSAIARVVDPIITKHGLSYRFRTAQSDRISVTCVLSHRAGHFEETTLTGPADSTGNKNAIQAIGSTLTYLQRYSLVQMLGLAASDDDDGKAGDAGGVITDKQADSIRVLLSDTKTDPDRFLKWAGAESVADIPAAKFNDALAMLNAKKNQKKAAKTEAQS